MEEKSDLELLKEEYGKIQEKFELPDFKEFNADFHIEKLAEVKTDFLIREIRKFMSEKFSNYLRFTEAILNPVNAPMFVFSIVKTISEIEKKKLAEIYKKLAKIEVDLIELDIQFVEEKEVEFVKKYYEMWQEIKKDLLGVLEVIKKNWDNKSEANGKGYLG